MPAPWIDTHCHLDAAEFDTDRGQEATPLMIDGVLYTTTAWSKVFAFDAKTDEARVAWRELHLMRVPCGA